MSDMEDPEGSYRRGYTHGAWDIIKAVEAKLSPTARAELHRWFENDAREWRVKYMRGENGRSEDGGVTHAITPPRGRLRL